MVCLVVQCLHLRTLVAAPTRELYNRLGDALSTLLQGILVAGIDEEELFRLASSAKQLLGHSGRNNGIVHTVHKQHRQRQSAVGSTDRRNTF